MMSDERIVGSQSLWIHCFPKPTKDTSAEMSTPGVGYAVEKGESIVQDNNYQLIG
jgi:hypothetical protein